MGLGGPPRPYKTNTIFQNQLPPLPPSPLPPPPALTAIVLLGHRSKKIGKEIQGRIGGGGAVSPSLWRNFIKMGGNSTTVSASKFEPPPLLPKSCIYPQSSSSRGGGGGHQYEMPGCVWWGSQN